MKGKTNVSPPPYLKKGFKSALDEKKDIDYHRVILLYSVNGFNFRPSYRA